MIVDDIHGLLYCYIPKVGCSNWKRVMAVLTGEYKSIDNITLYDMRNTTKISRNLNSLSKYSAEEIAYRLNNYFKFMFVRHPIEQLFSALHDKFYDELKYHQSVGVSIVKKIRKNPPIKPKGDDVTLEEFFKFLTVTPMNRFNDHWSSFTRFCQPCFIDYNFTGIYDDMQNEASYVIKHLGLSENVTFPACQHFYDVHMIPDDEKIKNWHKVSPDLLEKILKMYKKDFDLFGYLLPESAEEYIKKQINKNNYCDSKLT